MEKDRVIAQLIERLKSSRVDSLKLNKLTLPMSMQQEEMEKELADVKKKLQDSLENNTFLSVKLTKTQEMAEIYRKWVASLNSISKLIFNLFPDDMMKLKSNLSWISHVHHRAFVMIKIANVTS